MNDIDNSLVEAVARAIYNVGCTFDEKWDNAHPRTQMTYLEKARAAIAAMQARSAEPASDPCKLPAEPAGEDPVASTGWASPALGRAYVEIEKLRNALAQDPESGIDEALRRMLDCIEVVDVQLEGVAS